MYKTIFSAVGITVIAAFFCVGCGGGGGGQTRPSELVGQWEHESGATRGKPENLELFKDGTGVVDGGTISWKVENKRLVILSSSEGLACNYKISGYELAIAYDDGTSAIFVRKGKLEEYNAQKIAEEKKVSDKAKASISTFKDNRDGKVYKKVTIGGQTWMAENLNYQTSNSKCYGDEGLHCAEYGRLYSWDDAKTACPAGWHLPTIDEWTTLENSVGGRETAGTKLKSLDWRLDGTIDYGFAVLPAGQCNTRGVFSSAGEFGYMWTATEIDDDDSEAWSMNFDRGYERVRRDNDDKNNLASVRCLKN